VGDEELLQDLLHGPRASASRHAASPAWTGRPRTSSCRTTRATSTPSRWRWSIPHPLHWVFKKELSKIPVLRVGAPLPRADSWWDRRNAIQSRTALSNAASALQRGTTPSSSMWKDAAARTGSYSRSRKAASTSRFIRGLPIVPGPRVGEPRIVPSARCAFRPGHVVVELFDPIPTEGKKEADVPELMARVRTRCSPERGVQGRRSGAFPHLQPAAAVTNIGLVPEPFRHETEGGCAGDQPHVLKAAGEHRHRHRAGALPHPVEHQGRQGREEEAVPRPPAAAPTRTMPTSRRARGIREILPRPSGPGRTGRTPRRAARSRFSARAFAIPMTNRAVDEHERRRSVPLRSPTTR